MMSVAGALLLAALGGDPPAVVDAARNGDEDALRALIEGGADVNAREADGTTALHWASHRDLLGAVDLLIRAGADVNAANDLGATALWAASENGSAPVVERLLAAGADPDKALRRGETPLMIAARSGNPVVVSMLLEHGADPNAKGPRDQTALMWAAASRQPDVVAVLLEHGADVHARSEVRRELKAHEPHAHPENQQWFEHGGNTALMFAARVGDLASARHLVAAGANVDDTAGWGISAVTMAAYSNFGVFVAEPTFSSGGPYHLGGREGFRPGQFGELVELLLESGADPNLGSEKFTALHAAIMRRDEGTVDRLLEHGADPNLPLGTFSPILRGSSTGFYFHSGWIGATPVWLAARFGTPGILRRLVENGADPRFVHRGLYFGNSRGSVLGGGMLGGPQEEVTTLPMAALGMSGTGRAWVYQRLCSEEHEKEAFEKVRLLSDAGADLNAVDLGGRTVLDQAKALEYDSVIAFLVERGAEEGVAGEPGSDEGRRRSPCR